MAYQGYLIKIGNDKIEEKYVKFDSYNVLLSTNDVDSYRDANGKLHRNALAHRVAKVEFNTPYINSREFNRLMSMISSHYAGGDAQYEKKLTNVSVYIPETDSYINGVEMYVPDITVQIYKKNTDGTFLYDPVRIAFIGY